MMALPRSIVTFLCLLILPSMVSTPSLSQTREDSRKDVEDKKNEIDRVLKLVAVHAAAFKRTIANIPQSDDLEWDLSRLKAQWDSMDVALGSLPCGTAAPDPPNGQAAIDALGADPLGLPVRSLEKRIDAANQEMAFAKKVHTIAVMIYKLKLIAVQTDALMRILPSSDLSTFWGIVDDVKNLSPPGDVKNWMGSEEYYRYRDQNKAALFDRAIVKYRDMNKIDKDGKIRTDLVEFKRILSEVITKKTEQDVVNLKKEIAQAKEELTKTSLEDQYRNLRNKYLEKLQNQLKSDLARSKWMTHPEQFKKESSSITVAVVDFTTGQPIPNAQATLTPSSGLSSPLANGLRFSGVSLSSTPYRIEVGAPGYTNDTTPVTVIECADYPTVIRLKKPSTTPPTPSSPQKAVEANQPPEVRLEADTTSVQEGGVVNLYAQASDPEGDPLVFLWAKTGGVIVGDGAHVQLTTAGLSSAASTSPGTVTVTVMVSDGRGGTVSSHLSITVNPPTRLKAQLTCGTSLEIVPGEIDRSCGVRVSGWRGNTSDRVEVVFPQMGDEGAALPRKVSVFPGSTFAEPANMFTAGVTDLHNQFEFPFRFSAPSGADPGSIPIHIVVRQKGAEEVGLTLTVNVLSKGQIAVPGMGSPPPVRPGSGGENCVWRYKLLSDTDPQCWHFVATQCDNARYKNANNGYILAGTNMTRKEAEDLITAQSRFFSICEVEPGPIAGPSPQQVLTCNGWANQIQQLLTQCNVQTARKISDRFYAEKCDALPHSPDRPAADLQAQIEKTDEAIQRSVNSLRQARSAQQSNEFDRALQLASEAEAGAPGCLTDEIQDLVAQTRQQLAQITGTMRQAQDAAGACQAEEALNLLSLLDPSQLSPQHRQEAQSLRQRISNMMQLHARLLQLRDEIQRTNSPVECLRLLAKVRQTPPDAGGCDQDLGAELTARLTQCAAAAPGQGQPGTRPSSENGNPQEDLNTLRKNLEEWQKSLDCLEEGKRKTSSWQDCNGNWTMENRDVVIDRLRKQIVNARAKLGLPPLPPAAAGGPSATASAPGGNTPTPNSSKPPVVDHQALQEDLQRSQERLECLEEGKRKFGSTELDCNGSFMIGSRDGHIDQLRKHINQVRTQLGLPPVNPQAASTPETRPDVQPTSSTGPGAGGAGLGLLLVLDLYGDAIWYTPPAGPEQPIRGQEAVGPGSGLRTGASSHVSFRSQGKTTVTVNPNSNVRVSSGGGEKGRVVELINGSVDVNHPDGTPSFDDVVIRSPDGTITPRGTRYRVELDSIGTTVQVFEGVVHLSGGYIIKLQASGQNAGKPSPAKDLDLHEGERALIARDLRQVAVTKPSSGLPGWMRGKNATSTAAASPLVQADPWNNPKVQELMDRWIHSAVPPSKDPGIVMHYNEWLQPLSQAATSTGNPDHPPDWTRYRYVWENRNRYDSTNLCTLGEFLDRSLSAKGLEGCSKGLPSWMTASRTAPRPVSQTGNAVENARIQVNREEDQRRIEAQQRADGQRRLEAQRRAEEARRAEAQRQAEENQRLLDQQRAEQQQRIQQQQRAEKLKQIQQQLGQTLGTISNPTSPPAPTNGGSPAPAGFSGSWDCTTRITGVRQGARADVYGIRPGTEASNSVFIRKNVDGYVIDDGQTHIPSTYMRGNRVEFRASVNSVGGHSLGETVTEIVALQSTGGSLVGRGSLSSSDGSLLSFSMRCTHPPKR
ncbi:MAG: FecR domain-containing protein [Acidobacteriia bacterium]|nr:FecR domain-containing protein [Terriglobia bacterium]